MKEQNGAPAAWRIAVIGAGDAGRSFALACVAAGYSVVLEDVMPANLRRASAEYSEQSDQGAGSGSLELSSTLEDAVRSADIAVDFVPDELESKLEIFCLLDRMAPPKTILCTPTRLSVADLASCVYRPERVFAVRGAFTAGSSVRLQLTEQADRTIAAMVENFLVSLGLEVAREIEPDVRTSA